MTSSTVYRMPENLKSESDEHCKITIIFVSLPKCPDNFEADFVEFLPFNMSANSNDRRVPDFYDRLTEMEREEYDALARRVGSPENRYNRNRRLATLQEQLQEIRSFCIRHDGRDAERMLVCGICWFPSGAFAINVRQLVLLLKKSKSSVNGALAKMGYETVPTKDEDEQMLFDTLPFLRSHSLEQRQWTIRKRSLDENGMIGAMSPAPANEVLFKRWNDINRFEEDTSHCWSSDELEPTWPTCGGDDWGDMKFYECKKTDVIMEEDVWGPCKYYDYPGM